MVKHKAKGRKMRRYLKGNIDDNLDLGTLATKVLVGVKLAGTLDEEAYISSLKGTWSLSDFTEIADVGPILVGIAHGDYSDAEIEAFIENSGSWKSGDLVAQEVAKRKIRIVGAFGTRGQDAVQSSLLNDGKPITTKCGWVMKTGETIRMWAYNMGTAAVATTDPTVNLYGHANLWPR